MAKFKPLPPIERLQQEFRYEPDTGLIWWKKHKRGRTLARPAGCTSAWGYLVVNLDRRILRVHRVAWALHFGFDPAGLNVDHINGVRHDNRISNLRIATHSENRRNNKISRNCTSGFPGVYWDKKDMKWRARIKHQGATIYLGRFREIGEAVSARILASARLHGEYSGYFCREELIAAAANIQVPKPQPMSSLLGVTL